MAALRFPDFVFSHELTEDLSIFASGGIVPQSGADQIAECALRPGENVMPHHDETAITSTVVSDNLTINVEALTNILEQTDLLMAPLAEEFRQFQIQMIAEAFRVPRDLLGTGILTPDEVRRSFGGMPLRDISAAERRGETLLREWLSPAQIEQYDRSGNFEVRGCHTGRRYRISIGYSYNVQELDDDGSVADTLCFVPRGALVMGDIVLAQKVGLETDENAALKVANRLKESDVFGLSPVRMLRGTIGRPAWRLDNIDWGNVDAAVPTAPIRIALDRPDEPAFHPHSWLANWGRMARDLMPGTSRDVTSRRARRARR